MNYSKISNSSFFVAKGPGLSYQALFSEEGAGRAGDAV